MIKKLRVAVDHGNRNMKTCNFVFTTGLTEQDKKPARGEKYLKYQGKYYTLSEKRIPYQRDKTQDSRNRFWILTLFAIAMELEQKSQIQPEDVIQVELPIGLPPKHFAELCERYERYFKGDGKVQELCFNDKVYHLCIQNVMAFPQDYAAMMTRMMEIREIPKVVGIDIGGFTSDYLLMRSGRPDMDYCDSLEKGVITMYTSTKEQHLDRGIQEIERYCNEHEMALTNIFTDQETGKNFNRPRYTVLVEDVLRSGDILIVTELDRLGRNKYDTMQQIQRIKNMGVRLMVLELPTTLMDLSVMDNAMARMMLETINNMMLELYASMAQAELEKKEKRQREGIEAKKLRGEWDDYGRPSVMKQETFDENFQSVVSGETTPTQLRKNLGMTHSTFYRYRKTFYEKYPELSNSAN